MITKIKKWGNSFGIRLPKTIIEGLNLSENTELEILPTKEGIELKAKTKKQTLKDLCDQINSENRHSEIEWGMPVGKEII